MMSDTEINVEEDSKYLIIADSYFGSLETAKKMDERVWFILGVSGNMDRPITKNLRKRLKKTTCRSVYSSFENLSYTVYNDRSICTFLSNCISGFYETENAPSVAYYYNQWMNAVDLFDASLHLHYNSHKNQKWTQAII